MPQAGLLLNRHRYAYPQMENTCFIMNNVGGFYPLNDSLSDEADFNEC